MGFSGGSEVKKSACEAGDKETWVQSLSQEDPMKEEMATHSRILVGEITRTEEPGRLESMGSQKS